MATNILLTVDTEIRWRPDLMGRDWQLALAHSYDPAGVGIPYQLGKLAEHGLRAVFFVDPMPGLHFGIDPVKRMIEPILAAGQSIELHLHPQWARLQDDRPTSSFELIDYPENEQRALIERGCDLLIEAGAPPPMAFRAGSYSANAATLRAAASLGLRYDSSHNGSAHPWPSAIPLPLRQMSPVACEGITEIPVTLIAERSGYRHLQICAVSLRELQAALRHAVHHDHEVVTIISHSFELATRGGDHVNRVHRRKFDGLCAFLDDNRDQMPTRGFADLALSLDDRPAQPLPHNPLRTVARQAEQLWSNIFEERGR